MRLGAVLLKLAVLEGVNMFSPAAQEAPQNLLNPFVQGGGSAVARASGGSAGGGGFVSERLTSELGGGRQSYSRQAPQSTEALESKIKGRGLDLPRMQGLFHQMKGTDTPEGYNKALNIFNFESGGFNANAVGDRGGSIGLGQINLKAHPDMAGLNLKDPYVNLGAAKDIWNSQGPQRAYRTTYDRFGY